jgi:hypothetical protein
MLWHACAYALANKGHGTRAVQGLARPSVDHQHNRLHRADAEPVQGLLAGLGCRDFLDGVSDGSEAQSARMTFTAGSLPQDKLRHSRLADLVLVMRLERIPRLVKDHPQELDRLRIVGAVALHVGALQPPRSVSDHPSRTMMSVGCVTGVFTSLRGSDRAKKPSKHLQVGGDQQRQRSAEWNSS